jgi:DNA-binding PucR family transcriptional regulator
VALVDEDVVGLSSKVPPADGSVVMGVGPASPLAHIAESFASASRALDTAAALGLRGEHTMESLGVRPAVVADTAIGEALARRYIDRLHASPRIRQELAASVAAYIETKLSVNDAAERLVVHPNTLRYRLKRFEELTGADLRDPACLMEVWWALERSRITTAEPGRWTG